MTKSDFNCKPSFASALVRIFDFVLDTPARQCSFSCTFSRLGNSNKFDCARLIENVQINLTLPSLIRIFDCVLDTPSRHNQANACFCARLFVSLPTYDPAHLSSESRRAGDTACRRSLGARRRGRLPHRFGLRLRLFAPLGARPGTGAKRRPNWPWCATT